MCIVKYEIKMEEHMSWHLCCLINFCIAEEKNKGGVFFFQARSVIRAFIPTKECLVFL
jgi:hypothetical protein